MNVVVLVIIVARRVLGQTETGHVHSLRKHMMGVEGTDFPEHMETWYLDDVPFYHFNSTMGNVEVPPPEWLNESEGLLHWKDINYMSILSRSLMSAALKMAHNHLNSTGHHSRIHVYEAYGYCSLKSDGTYQSFMSHAYNGQDFVSFDVESKTWVASVSQAMFYKRKREEDASDLNLVYYFYKYKCIELLKIMLKHAPWIREKKVPEVHLFEKRTHHTSPGIELACHVTGFYPHVIQVGWLGEGEQPIRDGVSSSEVFPNGDGTYQLRTSLMLSSERQRTQIYYCLVLHSSIKGNLTVAWVPKGNLSAGIIAVAAAGAVTVLVSAVVGAIWRKRKCNGENAQENEKGGKNAENSRFLPQ